MINIRRSNQRGGADFGWLKSKHTFSFGNYYDERQMGFSALRVINDDRVAADSGFDTHGHRDMEIITYVRQGAISHQDGIGNKGRTAAGDVQVMSAGTGIQHGEKNKNKDKEVKFFQIWVFPNKKNVQHPPSHSNHRRRRK
mgnify:CR=1 FL=1